MAFSHRNTLAKQLRALHVAGNPVVFTNCYDGASAQAVIAHPSTKALATASYAIAATLGVEDAELSCEDNLSRVRLISQLADQAGLPLSADLQDGYRDIATNIVQVIAAGAVGANIEDADGEKAELRQFDDAVSRIKTAVKACKDAGVPDFCINARTDALVYGGSIEEVIKRGKAYLDAGATTVFVWGGPTGRGVSSDEIKQLVKAFDGRLNVKMNLSAGFLNVKEIAALCVARISIGPELFKKAVSAYKNGLEGILGPIALE